MEINSQNNTVEERLQDTVCKLLDKLISQKKEEVYKIDHGVRECKETLEKVKYKCVLKYYPSRWSDLGKREENDRLEKKEQFLLHPTVKRYLHKKPKNWYIDSEECLNTFDCLKRQTLPDKLSTADNDESKTEADTHEGSRFSKFNLKKKIIVGNLSRFLLEEDNPSDNATHKWMVYVRTPPNEKKLETFVKSVTFYLHESYAPNTEVVINNPPFNVTRRGWGEFHLKVLLKFKDEKNKPILLHHKIKLDKTLSGLQTTGNETTTTIELESPGFDDIKTEKNDNNTELSDNNEYNDKEFDEFSNIRIKEEVPESTERVIEDMDINITESAIESSSINVENIKKEVIDDLSITTSYTSPVENAPCIKTEKDDSQDYTAAINWNNSLTSAKSPQIKNSNRRKNTSPLSNFPQIKKICILNSDLRVKERREEKIVKVGSTNPRSILKSNLVFSLSGPEGVITEEEPLWMKTIHLNNYPNLETLINMIARKFPLIAETFSDKPLCSYQASSISEYLSWPIGKRRACERFRAYEIRRCVRSLLGNKDIFHKEILWTNSKILKYLRQHGFTFLDSEYLSFIKRVRVSERETNAEFRTWTPSNTIMDNLKKSSHLANTSTLNNLSYRNISLNVHDSDDEDIDIVNVAENDSPKKMIALNYSREKTSKDELSEMSKEAAFVHHQAELIGIRLKSVQVGKTKSTGLTEEIIFKSATLLMEDLVRKSLAVALAQNQNDLDINSQTVQAVLKSEDKFDLFTNAGSGIIVEN
ncbi:DgyrCDS9995 [Dimorphilus gyrociliatus]|uniref:DgyrCDS9995 n=1 Tax=Dimorphilus gyrociliatus TaxID=2664684 RepID=A0A7I8W1G6_9ANNE|nr:DgyrCDS9995 [Dimorphilus gyrociliatus]